MDFAHRGVVISVSDGIARVRGLASVGLSELVRFSNGVAGLVLNLEPRSVSVVILGDERAIVQGTTAHRTHETVTVPVGKGLCGRVVDSLGLPIDGSGPVEFEFINPVDVKAPGIIPRKSVNEPLQTGILAIDSMLPIGRGQRELIIGDRQMGKTALAVDSIINQKNTLTESEKVAPLIYCVYVAIGQKRSTVARIVDRLRLEGAH